MPLSVEDLERALAKSKYKPNTDSKIIGYARVSTQEQNLDMQLDALRKAGVDDDDLYSEHVSGVSRRRPRLAAALKALRPGDTFLVWKLDRLGRSAPDLYAKMQWFEDNGVAFKSICDGLDTSTAIGRAFFGWMAVMAQFERDLIVDRTRAGVKRAKERGQRFGAEKRFNEEKAKAAFKLGRSASEVATMQKVSRATVYHHFPAQTQDELREQGVRKRSKRKR